MCNIPNVIEIGEQRVLFSITKWYRIWGWHKKFLNYLKITYCYSFFRLYKMEDEDVSILVQLLMAITLTFKLKKLLQRRKGIRQGHLIGKT